MKFEELNYTTTVLQRQLLHLQSFLEEKSVHLAHSIKGLNTGITELQEYFRITTQPGNGQTGRKNQTTLWFSQECGEPTKASRYNDSTNTSLQHTNAKQLDVWFMERLNVITALRMTLDSGILPLHGTNTQSSLERLSVGLSGDPLVHIQVKYSSAWKGSKGHKVLTYLELQSHSGKNWTIGYPYGRSCVITVPSGYQIVGFFGKEGLFVDSLGVIASLV
jgi:hypothetical protein